MKLPLRDPAGELANVLARERQALLAGDLTQIERLTVLKQRLVETLDTRGLSTAQLEALARAAQRNQRLLAASGQGLRAAIQRIGQIRDTAGCLSSYDRDGAPCDLGTHSGHLNRRS